jgi:hypothetical protein
MLANDEKMAEEFDAKAHITQAIQAAEWACRVRGFHGRLKSRRGMVLR